jgi:hypothetical protein
MMRCERQYIDEGRAFLDAQNLTFLCWYNFYVFLRENCHFWIRVPFKIGAPHWTKNNAVAGSDTIMYLSRLLSCIL